jgi:PKD repeat protein
MFDDGSISTEKNPVHEYAEPGIYEVSLTVMDSSGTCMDYLSEQIQVGTVDCNADFSVFIDSLTNTAYFYNQSMGSSNTYYWIFGDGTKSTDQNPVHQFIAPGFYNVRLNVFNDQTGCMDIHEQIILIGSMGIGCKADFIYLTDETTNNVAFSDKSLGSDLSWFWYFGDGAFSTDQHPEHTYPEGGIYNVCLTVYTTGGLQDTRCKYIFAGTPAAGSCLAQFIYTVNDAARTVNYTDKSFGEPDTWNWRFGDNNTSGLQNPEHIFTEAGYYITQLTVKKQSTGCISHAVEIINVDMAGALKAGYGYFVDTLNTKAESYPVDYIGVSLGDASKYKWSFGDGTYDSTTTTPTHEYTAPGIYEVCLTVYNQVTGAEDTYCESVIVGPVSTGEFNYETFSMLCYPNPADNSCMIILDLPVTGYTELSLYSITGSKLRTIVRETLHRGRHSYELKSSELENGLYIIQLLNSSGAITQMLNVQH